MHTTLNSHVDFYGGRKPENPRSIGKNNTSNKLNSHIVSAELQPVTRTFGTTLVKDDALAAYATHATLKHITISYTSVHPCTISSRALLRECSRRQEHPESQNLVFVWKSLASSQSKRFVWESRISRSTACLGVSLFFSTIYPTFYKSTS
jgi:hypothetical protein